MLTTHERFSVKTERPARRFIRIAKVQEMTGYSRPSIYRLVDEKKFPCPVKLGHAIAWFEDEVIDWMNSRPRVKPVADVIEEDLTLRPFECDESEEVA
jgi:prophage regulatory protein